MTMIETGRLEDVGGDETQACERGTGAIGRGTGSGNSRCGGGRSLRDPGPAGVVSGARPDAARGARTRASARGQGRWWAPCHGNVRGHRDGRLEAASRRRGRRGGRFVDAIRRGRRGGSFIKATRRRGCRG